MNDNIQEELIKFSNQPSAKSKKENPELYLLIVDYCKESNTLNSCKTFKQMIYKNFIPSGVVMCGLRVKLPYKYESSLSSTSLDGLYFFLIEK